jgi:multicomponent Na+:H+ antiporter subunit G
VSKTQLAIDALLALGCLTAVLSALGVLVMKDFYERLHYMAPPADISVWCFALAIVLDKHFSQAGIKAVLIAVVLFVMNAVLTHATARAARVRQFGRWIEDPTQIRGTGDESTAGLNSRPLVDVSDEWS